MFPLTLPFRAYPSPPGDVRLPGRLPRASLVRATTPWPPLLAILCSCPVGSIRHKLFMLSLYHTLSGVWGLISISGLPLKSRPTFLFGIQIFLFWSCIVIGCPPWEKVYGRNGINTVLLPYSVIFLLFPCSFESFCARLTVAFRLYPI